MTTTRSSQDRLTGALYGMFIADALAMPVHWYYDTAALRRDYGEIRTYLPPRNPHPDSILWRSAYTPRNSRSDILGSQAKYWGRRNIHYHQFLEAGENTLNLKLARELLAHLLEDKGYDRQRWLDRFIAFMTHERTHRDTYAEEYLRHFFANLGAGVAPEHCGRDDERHIGGVALMLPLLLVYSGTPGKAKSIALDHLALTHGGEQMARTGELLADILLGIMAGEGVEQAIDEQWRRHFGDHAPSPFDGLVDYPDEVVVGRHFSTACYLEHAVPATLYLATKYQYDPEAGLLANTMCGGDNCGRGALLGALLGAAGGMRSWPARWLDGLVEPPPPISLYPW